MWAGRLDSDMATRKRHTPEQVVRKLAEADRLLGEGKSVADVCRQLQVSEQTYFRWRNKFGCVKADDAKRPFARHRFECRERRRDVVPIFIFEMR